VNQLSGSKLLKGWKQFEWVELGQLSPAYQGPDGSTILHGGQAAETIHRDSHDRTMWRTLCMWRVITNVASQATPEKLHS